MKAAKGAKARGAKVVKHCSSALCLNTSTSPSVTECDSRQRQPFAQYLLSK